MLDSRGGLSVAILIYYIIGLVPAVYVVYKQGPGRHGGWLYLVSLPIVRIVGASAEIAAEQQTNPSSGLITTAAICNGIGLVPLLLVLLSLVQRANDRMQRGIPSFVFLAAHAVAAVGLGLSIYGSIDAMPTNDADTIKNGQKYRKISAAILLAVYIGSALLALITVLRVRKVWQGDRKCVWASAASLPFLLVRVIYTLCVAFATSSTAFNAYDPNVYVQAFMQVVMEFIIWAIFCAAGLFSPSVKDVPRSADVDLELRNQGQMPPRKEGPF